MLLATEVNGEVKDRQNKLPTGGCGSKIRSEEWRREAVPCPRGLQRLIPVSAPHHTGRSELVDLIPEGGEGKSQAVYWASLMKESAISRNFKF
jgi:hypothetical protein